MKIKIICMLTVLTCLFSTCAIADSARERIYLIQMLNQLDSLKPLIIAANKEQAPDARIKFHYTAYCDANEKKHNGLLEDINEIKKGIQEKLNGAHTEPRNFSAIKGDYLGSKRSAHVK